MEINKIIQDCNKEQYSAITSQLGSSLIIAGAGSGKTRVLTLRILYVMLNYNISQEKILAITFTNKATNEMKTRLQNYYGNNKVNIHTYHALCVRILRQEITTLGYNQNFNIIDDEEQKIIIKQLVKDANFDIKHDWTKIINLIKEKNININNLYSHQEFKQHYAIIPEIASIYKKYITYLKEANLLDFDDLLKFTLQIFDNNQAIAQKWKARFEYILVDEFQDTNHEQFRLLQYLINSNENIFVVGDQDQTIYTWRGAYPYIFDDFVKIYKNTNTIILNQNYRSTQKILNTANVLIAKNNNRFKKQLFSNSELGNDVYFFHGDINSNNKYLCKKITEIKERDNLSYNDFAILYRTNAQYKFFENSLIIANIPYRLYGGFKFYQRKEIKDLISYLKILNNHEDELSLKRIINVPTRNIGLTTIEKISTYANFHNISFATALWSNNDDITWDHRKVWNFTSTLKEIENIKETKISDILNKIIEITKYIEYLKDMYITDADEHITNVNELIESIKIYENENEDVNLATFLQDISLLTQAENEKKDDAITLMTIHMAKGTEFNTVFIYGLNEGVLPSYRGDDVSEERRIFYVGLTRARKNLFLMANTGYDYIRNSDFHVSTFIDEIRSTIVNDKIEYKSISNADLGWYNSANTKPIKWENENPENFEIGDKIIHTFFGEGTVVSKDGDTIGVSFLTQKGIKYLKSNHIAIKRKK